MAQKRLMLALLFSLAILLAWAYLFPTESLRQERHSVPISQAVDSPQSSTTMETPGSWRVWRIVGRLALGLIVGALLLLGILLFFAGATEGHQWPRIARFTLTLCLLAVFGYLLKEIIHYFNSPAGITTTHTTLRFARITAVSSAGLSLLLNGVRSAVTSGGYSTDPSAEWRYVNRDGGLGGRYGPASVRDVYEHQHGRGSWERRQESLKSIVLVLRAVAFILAIVLPLLAERWPLSNEVSKVMLLFALAVVSLSIAVAVSQSRTLVGSLILAVTLGLWWVTE